MKKITIKKVLFADGADLDCLSESIDWEEVKEAFVFEDEHYEQITPNKTKYTRVENNISDYLSPIPMMGYRIRSGLESSKKILQLKIFDKEEDCFIHLPRRNQSYIKNLKNELSNDIKIEKELFRPFVKAPDISNLQSLKNIKLGCAFPYKSNKDELIEEEELKNEYFETWTFFNKYKEEITPRTQRADGRLSQKEFYGIQRVGDYTFQKKHVLLRDNTKWVVTCSHENITTDFGISAYPLFEKHLNSISERCSYERNNNIIGYINSDDELFYVTGILSTDIVKDYMESSNSARGFSFSNLPFYLPHYDPENKIHQNISKLTQEQFDKEIDDSFKKELNLLYKELIESITGNSLQPYTPL